MSKPIFAILRALIALVIGFLLAFNPEDATKIIVILIGVLFLLIGIVSVVYNVKAVRSVSAAGRKSVLSIRSQAWAAYFSVWFWRLCRQRSSRCQCLYSVHFLCLQVLFR